LPLRESIFPEEISLYLLGAIELMW